MNINRRYIVSVHVHEHVYAHVHGCPSLYALDVVHVHVNVLVREILI